MPSTSGTRSLNVTLLTVHLANEAIEEALRAAEDRDWAVTELSFESYISSKRRPHFPANLKDGDGCVALIDFEADARQAAAAAAYLQGVFAGRIAIIAVADAPDPQRMLMAMRAGCTEFLPQPLQEGLPEALRRAGQQLLQRNAAAAAAGSILAFFGAKGGVGTTTLAVHLAVYLAEAHGRKVLLIDNHPQFGHACIYLGLDGNAHTFAETVRNVTRLDSELLRGFVATHASGVDVLSSPDAGQTPKSLHADDVAATLEFLRGEYDFVLIDNAATLDEVNRAVVEVASEVYLVATPEVGAIRDLSRQVDELLPLAELNDKVKVVINRYSSQFAVSMEEIEKAVRLSVSYSVPNNYIELVRSANLGVPISADHPSGFTAEVLRWARLLVGAAETESIVPAVSRRARPLEHLRRAFAGLGRTRAVVAERRV